MASRDASTRFNVWVILAMNRALVVKQLLVPVRKKVAGQVMTKTAGCDACLTGCR